MAWWRKLLGIPEPQPSKNGILSQSRIRNILGPHAWTAYVSLWDNWYDAANEKELLRVARKYRISGIVYVKEKSDCDNIAAACFGSWHLEEATRHMAKYLVQVKKDVGAADTHLMCGVCRADKFRLYEPQREKFFDIPASWYLIEIIG